VPTSVLELDGLFAGVGTRLDALLLSADEADEVYKGQLRRVTLELLGIEKKIAAEGGKPNEVALADTGLTILDGVIAAARAQDWNEYNKRWAALQKKRLDDVRSIEKQEQAVEGAAPDTAWRSMEEYLKERLNPARQFFHVRFSFFETLVEYRDASGNVKFGRATTKQLGLKRES